MLLDHSVAFLSLQTLLIQDDNPSFYISSLRYEFITGLLPPHISRMNYFELEIITGIRRNNLSLHLSSQ